MTARRERAAWLLAATLALAGTQVAHAVAYRIAIPDHHRRAEELAASGHQYLSYLPLAFGALTAAVIVALACRLRHLRQDARYRGPRLVRFALFAPLLFTAQEHLERLARTGSFPWSAAGDRTFVIGLVLQLPFAVFAYLSARLVLRAASRVARWLFTGGRLPLPGPLRDAAFAPFELPVLDKLVRGGPPRAPPALLR